MQDDQDNSSAPNRSCGLLCIRVFSQASLTRGLLALHARPADSEKNLWFNQNLPGVIRVTTRTLSSSLASRMPQCASRWIS